MASYLISLLIQRLILPVLLSACILLRPVLLSSPYLIFLFILPFIPIATPKLIRGCTGYYHIALMVVSVLLFLGHTTFHIVIVSLGFDVIPKCRSLEVVLRHVGLVRLNALDALSITKWILPEILMLVGSISIYVILRLLNKSTNQTTAAENVDIIETRNGTFYNTDEQSGQTKWLILSNIGKILSLIALCVIATIQPSVPSFIYFVVFLGAVTWWGCNQSLKKAFAIILRITLFFLIIHITSYLAYQNPWPQKIMKPDTLIPRILGFTAIYSSTCANGSDIRVINFNSELEADYYLNPILLMLSYFVIAISSNVLLDRKGFFNRKRKLSDYNIAMTNLQQREQEDNFITDNDNSQNESKAETEILEKIGGAFKSVGRFFYNHSFILSNFAMMAWSIVFHSWLAFALLLWANLIWIIPNPRRNMLYSSPALVIYAHLLLVSTFLYGMDLKLDELPSDIKIDGFNLAQIGFVRYYSFPIGPLMLKIAFTLVFMISLRQFVQELRDKISEKTDVVQSESEFMKKIKKIAHGIFVRLWILVVMLTIFLYGILGPRMTGFRIIYMGLFLIFILIYIFSFSAWKCFMYSFWLLVIFYSMAVLVLVYTYQFDKFDIYWEQYLLLPLNVQFGIGLEIYETKDLFAQLLTLTLIVIITIVQLHYCHKKFKKFVEIPQSQEGMINYSTNEAPTQEEPPTEEPKPESKFKAFMKKCWEKLKEFWEIILLFLEIHFHKILMFALFSWMIIGVKILNIGFVLIAVIGVLLKNNIQIFLAKLAAFIASILLIANMIYQLDFVYHEKFETNCTNINRTATGEITNDAEWIGMKQVTDNASLLNLINPYLLYTLLVLKYSVLKIRQIRKRILFEQKADTPTHVFEGITREDAEKGIPELLKYMINYGFFRFGVEICLATYILVIGVHMDVFACLYVFWFGLLFFLCRSSKRTPWTIAIVFNMLMILVQFGLFIGLPPSLCIEYPWINDEFLKDLKVWALLPKNTFQFKERSSLLMLDFLLLLVMCQQRLVFIIENRFQDLPVYYIGGDNKSIISNIEKLGTLRFVNPTTHDFTSELRNYLDVLKRFVFSISYWLTLAAVFLAGTASVSILSFGYIIGSFIFLWQGTDFYLRPIRRIHKSWNKLIAYNIFVIFVKTYLQLIGCLFLQNLQTSTCWLVQVFAITCVVSRRNEEVCSVANYNSSLVWDGICFLFLIFQRRIFSSDYFCHIITETRASLKLASRGSELLTELDLKEKEKQIELESRMLETIKYRIDRIKKIKTSVDFKENKSHDEVVQCGDYYMFDDEEDEEMDLMDFNEKCENIEDQKSPEMQRLKKKLTLGQLLKKLRKDEEQERLRQKEIARRQELQEQQDAPESSDDHKNLTETENEESKDSFGDTLKRYGNYLSSTLVSITKAIYKISWKYRYVMRTLSEEKNTVKKKMKFGRGLSHSRSAGTLLEDNASEDNSLPISPFSSIRDDESILRHPVDEPTAIPDESEQKEKFGDEFSIHVEFIISLWYLFLSNTDVIVYTIVFINQIYSASILSLPLPLLVFLWGTLTLPRPSKSFWITLIIYTQCLVLLKFLFQFQIWPWMNNVILDNEPFAAVRILGIESKPGYATFDLLLLLALFWHRIILRSLGLWDSKPVIEEPTMNRISGINEFFSAYNQRATLRRELDSLEIQDYADKPQPARQESVEFSKNIFKRIFYEMPLRYIKNLCNPQVRKTDDVYKYLFLCDFINFFVILFGFSAFGTREGDGGVLSYFQDNVVPVLFLSMLLMQFFFIVLDRGLYLRKNMMGKLMFQYFTIVGLHAWMFFVLPATTDRSFNSTAPPVIYYLLKCYYLLFSAYQIRCGYPLRILGNFLTKAYNIINQYSFKVYMMIPFLMELRTLMDWMWTDTSMSLFEWLTMENIFGSAYDVKCEQEQGKESPDPSGEKYSRSDKYLIGGGLIVLIIIIIWFPLLLFGLAGIVGQASIPFDVSVSLRIGPYEPVYVMSAQDNNIIRLNETWNEFINPYASNRSAVTFLSNYEPDDVVAVILRANSSTTWDISPPDRIQLLKDLRENSTLTCRFRYDVLRRTSASENPGLVSDEATFELKADNPIRSVLVDMLEGKISNETSVILSNMMPRFIAVRNRGVLSVVNQLQRTPGFQNLTLRLFSMDDPISYWWEASEVCNDKDFLDIFRYLPFTSCGSHLTIYLFNDRIFPSSIGVIAAGGIIGLYTTFILLFWNFLRSTLFSGNRNDIMFEDLPFVDRLLQLCLDIYLVREAMMFALEEYLYAKLIFLHRSPETLIKWTRPRNRNNNENDEQNNDSIN